MPARAGEKRTRTFFFFNDTATTEIYTLSLHDALPISSSPGLMRGCSFGKSRSCWRRFCASCKYSWKQRCESSGLARSEEHTSELQSQSNLVCRLLLEKKKETTPPYRPTRSRASIDSRS